MREQFLNRSSVVRPNPVVTKKHPYMCDLQFPSQNRMVYILAQLSIIRLSRLPALCREVSGRESNMKRRCVIRCMKKSLYAQRVILGGQLDVRTEHTHRERTRMLTYFLSYHLISQSYRKMQELTSLVQMSIREWRSIHYIMYIRF